MASGKNIFFIIDGVKLHHALKSFGSDMKTDEYDTTSLGSSGAFRTYVAGFKGGELSLEGMWDADTTNTDEIDDVMKAAFDGQSAKQLLISFGTIANGGPALMLKDAKVLEYAPKIEIGALIMCTARLRADNAIEPGKFHYYNSASGADNGTSVDNSASSANGGYYQGHLYQESDSAATNASFKLQHSTDNSTWADVESAQSVGAARGSISRAVTGTINRYTRIVFTPSGGKGYGVAAFVRR